MKYAWIGFLPVIMLMASMPTDAAPKGSVDEEFTVAIGRLVRGGLRFPFNALPNVLANPNGETVEEVIQSYVNSPTRWSKFSLAQKREFTIVALVLSEATGGELVMLLMLLEKDADRIAGDLSVLTDSQLEAKFQLNAAGIQAFRTKLRILQSPEQKK